MGLLKTTFNIIVASHLRAWLAAHRPDIWRGELAAHTPEGEEGAPVGHIVLRVRAVVQGELARVEWLPGIVGQRQAHR